MQSELKARQEKKYIMSYKKKFPNGKRIRSLGCAPCTVPIYDYESERNGRWRGTIKRAGECGILSNVMPKILAIFGDFIRRYERS